MIPYYPADDGLVGDSYNVATAWERLVCEYTGLNIAQVQGLPYDEYLLLRRDAFITAMRRTEKGRDYLKNAERLEQTKPDRKRLREKLGRR